MLWLLLAAAAGVRTVQVESSAWPSLVPAAARVRAPRMNFLKEPAGAADAGKSKEAALVEWLEANGVRLSDKAGWGVPAHALRVEGSTMEDFEDSGRGILARTSIRNGDPFMTVPGELIMTKDVAERVLPFSIGDVGEYLALALLLMYERARGDESFWAPYIEILPTAEEVGQTWLWSDEDLAKLEGSNVVDDTASLSEKLQREYGTIQTILAQAGLQDDPRFGFETFQWAMSMLFSRAINLREVDKVALVPYADLLNHSPYVSSGFFFNQIPLSGGKRQVVLYADRDYAKGDQVLITYGQKSNAELALLYGFVVDRNLYDEVQLRVALAPDDARFEEKAAFLTRQRLKPAMTFPLLIDRYSNELIQFLRLACLTESGSLDSFAYNEPISVANERAALTALRDGCENALRRYAETEQEDAALMDNGRLFTMLSRNQRMAVKLRRNEKRILLRTIRVCETQLQDLAQQPF
jgi:[ribulose-bisphosphate carboxylase]-lysine N-methyltransferase